MYNLIRRQSVRIAEESIGIIRITLEGSRSMKAFENRICNSSMLNFHKQEEAVSIAMLTLRFQQKFNVLSGTVTQNNTTHIHTCSKRSIFSCLTVARKHRTDFVLSSNAITAYFLGRCTYQIFLKYFSLYEADFLDPSFEVFS